MATDESMRVSSSIAIAYERVSPPAPPYSSGIGIPMSPSSASSATSSYGKRLWRSGPAGAGQRRPYRRYEQHLRLRDRGRWSLDRRDRGRCAHGGGGSRGRRRHHL